MWSYQSYNRGEAYSIVEIMKALKCAVSYHEDLGKSVLQKALEGDKRSS